MIGFYMSTLFIDIKPPISKELNKRENEFDNIKYIPAAIRIT